MRHSLKASVEYGDLSGYWVHSETWPDTEAGSVRRHGRVVTDTATSVGGEGVESPGAAPDPDQWKTSKRVAP